MLTTFTLRPRRLRILAVKVTVSVALAILAAVLTALMSRAGLAPSNALGRDVSMWAGVGPLGG
jgi:hypothetical protein